MDARQHPSAGGGNAAANPVGAPVGDAIAARNGVQVQLRTLVLIRWVAVAGQAITLLLVHFGFGFTLPIVPALLVVGASAALNLLIARRHGLGARLSEEVAAFHLAFDIMQLALLLYLTGGLRNPFDLLLIAPVTVSASILSTRSTVGLALLAIGCASLLAVLHLPLPWDGGPPDLPALYLLAKWAAVVCAIGFIAAYVSQVATEARRMSDALAAAQLALAREQRISALGTLAAAAAHELGSPLATIAVVAREIARDLPPDSPLAEDMELLLSQTARCRDIIAELARRPEAQGGDPFLRLPLADLIDEAAAPHQRPEVSVEIVAEATEGPEPQIARTPELVHGLGNLLANAIQFANSRVEVLMAWNATEVRLTVADDGPGFPSYLLSRLGEPYLSSRSGQGGHMGLGIFIAQTLLQRTGAKVRFSNRRQGGAEVAVRWARAILESGGDERNVHVAGAV